MPIDYSEVGAEKYQKKSTLHKQDGLTTLLDMPLGKVTSENSTTKINVTKKKASLGGLKK